MTNKKTAKPTDEMLAAANRQRAGRGVLVLFLSASAFVRIVPAQEHGGPVGEFDADIHGLCGPRDVWSGFGTFDSPKAALEAAREVVAAGDY